MTATDWFQLTGLSLAFLSLIAAVVATKFAADSAKAAKETVEPMKEMAASLEQSVVASEKVLVAMRALVMRAEAAAELSLLNRQADQLVHRIGIYERVTQAAEHMREGLRRVIVDKMPKDYLESARADLRGALSLLPPDGLPAARQLADEYHDISGALVRVANELPTIVRATHQELAALEQRIAEREAPDHA